MRTSNVKVLLTVFLVLLFAPAIIYAQGSSTATVTGTVTDQKGSAVPNASVEIRDTATNASRSQTTNDAGYYTFVSVPPGTYTVVIKKDGFRTTNIGPLAVQVGRSATVDAQLEIGTISQVVEVQANAGVELQTMDSSVGNVLDRKVLDTIPTLARDATALLLLQPLATPGFNAVGTPAGGGEGDNTGGQIAGARSDQNTFLLDGGDVTDSTAGGGQYSGTNFGATPRGVVPTPVESLEEFRVVTTNSSASFSRSAGGEVQMVTKRGSNAFHGAVYDYLQNDHLNANTWNRNSAGKPDPLLQDNRFGGRLGGPIWKDKTFFFAHYEGRRFNSSTDISRRVPSCNMKLGILAFGGVEYNLNPGAVTDCAGAAIQPANCGTVATPAPCDPRGLGLNPAIAAVWAKEPTGDSGALATATGADGINTLGFTRPVGIPIREEFGVIRLDHVINSKWQFMTSYRYGKTSFTSPVQADIGGLLSGNQIGVPKSTALRPLAPRYVVAGLTGQITPHLTSDFRFDWMRHWWEWATLHPSVIPAPQGFPQANGLNAALSISGEGIGVGMQPINVDTQNARSRLWNGKEYNIIENLSWVKSNHLFQFGGRIGHQHFFHRRDDKVVGGLTSEVFTIGRLSSGSHVNGIPFPVGFAGSASRWRTDYASILGIMERAQQLFTRGPDFSPNPAGTPLRQSTVVDSYSLYASDSWRVKPSLTVTLGLNWGVQLPPYESSGEQTMVVDDSTGKVIDFDKYIETRRTQALAGQIYNPQLDYVPIKQLGRKYPYDPDWSNFGPRVAVAWNPSYSGGVLGNLFGGRKGVLRGGYARVYDRINGVGIVMIPALGVGFGNNLRCAGPQVNAGVVSCGTSTPSNAFRIGKDGTTVPMPPLATIPSGKPLIPGTNSPFETLDFRINPKRKIGYADTFDVTFQRQLGNNALLEVGYVGNYAKKLYQGYAAQQVPYMYTLGGQSFAKAWSNVAQAIIKIGSNGRSNYNAGFVSLRKTTSAGLNLTFNYTYSHAFDQIGQNQESLNEASDAFKLDRDYGSAQFDRRHVFTSLVTYDLPFGGGKRYSSGSGAVNKIIGGWNVSGVWTYATGLPLDIFNGASCQELGQGAVFGNCSSYFPLDNKVVHGSVHNSGGSLTAFPNADAVNNDPLGGYSFFAPPDPAIYGRTGRGFYRSLNRWNVDFGVSKATKITERVSTRFDCQMTNVFNHPMFSDPFGLTDISGGSFGKLNNQYNGPRFIQFGLRFDF